MFPDGCKEDESRPSRRDDQRRKAVLKSIVPCLYGAFKRRVVEFVLGPLVYVGTHLHPVRFLYRVVCTVTYNIDRHRRQHTGAGETIQHLARARLLAESLYLIVVYVMFCVGDDALTLNAFDNRLHKDVAEVGVFSGEIPAGWDGHEDSLDNRDGR